MLQTHILAIFLPIYGISLLVVLLNIKSSSFTKNKIIKLLILIALVVIINIFVLKYFGYTVFRQFYRSVILLFIYIAFHIISQYKGIKLLFTLLTTISFSCLPILFILILRILTDSNTFFMLVGCFAVFLLMFIFVLKFMSSQFIYILEHVENRMFWKFSVLPILYYLYNYLNSRYTFTQYNHLNIIIIGFIPDILVFLSYVLLIDIYKKQNLKNTYNLLSTQIDVAIKQIHTLKTLQNQTAIYRHDMRHHFSLINAYLMQGELQKAQHYLKHIESSITSFTPLHFCENNTANLILSMFFNKAKSLGICLEIDVVLAKHVCLSDIELCTLLSNGLENAINAASKVSQIASQNVYINCRISDNRFLLYIENNFEGEIVLKNNMPKVSRKDHGFGTKSMKNIAEKWNGYCACEIIEHIFILRIVLPLQE